MRAPTRVVRSILAILCLMSALGAWRVATAPTVHADGGLDYPVDPITAAIGVFVRYGPHVDDTQRIVGDAASPGDTVQLLCGVTDGDPVGDYNNTTWHFVSDLNQPALGNFWINDHYLDTPNLGGQLTPGETMCPNESADPLAPPLADTEPWPWGIPTTSAHYYVDHVEWIMTDYGRTLAVYMTELGYTTAFLHQSDAFNEAMNDAHMWYDPNLFHQFVCHALIAPPWKASWDLDLWRPDLGVEGDVLSGCNPLPPTGDWTN